MKHRSLLSVATFLALLISPYQLLAADGVLKIGLNTSLSGSFANVGASTKNGAELALSEINVGNGLKIGSKTYTIEYVSLDNASNRSSAGANTVKFISQEKVIALVGPQSSDRAIAAGEVANSFKTPMITPWSTSPLTTQNRPFVFRMPVLYDIQATATTKFAAKEWKATKAAVIYDEVSPYPSGMAKAFKKIFEETNGQGSVVAFETFRTGDTDFSKQLRNIQNSNADFIYTPQHYEEIPLIVKQARKLGWQKPITGSNSWGGGDFITQCGDDCKGLYFTGNFAAGGTTGKAKDFVDKYQKNYKKLPDEPAALTYDAVKLLAVALQNMKELSGNLLEDRIHLRDAIAAIKNLEGVTGTLSYQGTGDPVKCTVLIKVNENGILTTHDKVCP